MTIRRELEQEYAPADWRQEMVTLLDEIHAGGLDRRDFLTGIAAVLTLTAANPLFAQAQEQKDNQVKDEDKPAFLSEDPWLTLSVVHGHLFPTTDDAPGAKEINATSYLKDALAQPDMNPNSKEFILDGVGWLNDLADNLHKAVFADLNETQREGVLRHIEQTSAGERWIGLVLLYLFEALLSDPVYGGNTGEAGWRWLEHQPGFPRPPANKRYHEL